MPIVKLQTSMALLVIGVTVLVGCSRPEVKRARFLAEGHKFFEAKDYVRAILAFKNAAQAAPRDAEAQYQLGLTSLALGDARSALMYFKKATELNPAHTPAQLKVAQLLAHAGDNDLIEDAHKRTMSILADSPDNLEAMQTLALADLELGRPEEAERQLRQALSRFPRSLASSVTLADLLLARKDLRRADEVLKEAASQAPDSCDAAVALAALYLMTGRQIAAEEQIRHALAIDRKNGPALIVLASIQTRLGKAAEAERTYKEISGLPSAEYKPLYALYLLQSGKRGEGMAELEKLAKEDPGNQDLRRRLLSAYLSTGNLEAAAGYLTRAVRKEPRDMDLRYQRSRLYLGMGRYSEAQSDINEVLHVRPHSGEAHYYYWVINRTF